MNFRNIFKYFVFILLILFFYSCSEDIPKYGEVLYVDNEAKTVSYKKVEIKGLSSLDELSGKNFKYLLNTKISQKVTREASESITQTSTVDDVRDLIYQDTGEVASLRYRVSSDTIIPYSIEDSILLTLHYNLQESLNFFESIGLNLNMGANGEPFGQMNIHFESNFEIFNEFLNDFESMKDNALYYPILNILAFLPQDTLKHLALVSNPMVITHEFSHAIFAYAAAGVMKGSDPMASYTPGTDCRSVENEFYQSSMNEGLADYWAARRTGSSDLFYLSITKNEMSVHLDPTRDRSLDNNRNLTSAMLTSCSLEEPPSYYNGGTILASAMWEAEKISGIESFDKFLLQSYACLHQEFNKYNNLITLATPGNCFIKTLKSENVQQSNIDKVCNILKKRFAIIQGDLNECN